MKLNFKVLGSTAGLAVLVLAFQNCSPVNFGASDQRAGKSGLVAPIDDGLNDDVDDKSPAPVADDGPNLTNPDYDYTDNSITNPSVPPRSGDVYRAACAEAIPSSGAIKLNAGSSISGQYVYSKFKAPSMKSISGNHGDMVILRDGEEGTGKIDSVSGNGAKVVLCGFHIKSLSGSTGQLVLVNSHVEKLSGNSSNIKAVDSSFGSQSGNGGVLQVGILE